MAASCRLATGQTDIAKLTFITLAFFTLANGNVLLFVLALNLGGIVAYTNRIWWVGVFGLALLLHVAGVDRLLPVLLFSKHYSLSGIVGVQCIIVGVQCIMLLFLALQIRLDLHKALAFVVVASLPLFSVDTYEAPLLMAYTGIIYAIGLLSVLFRIPDRAVVALAAVYALAGSVLALNTSGSDMRLAIPVVSLFAVVILNFFNKRLVGPPMQSGHLILSTGLLVTIFLTAFAALRHAERSFHMFIEPDIAEVGNWVRQNTPPQSVILPVNINGFSAVSRRPIWVDWHIGAVVMWDPSLHEMWNSRYQNWRALASVEDAAELAQEEDIRYIVFKKSENPVKEDDRLRLVYEDLSYWVAQKLP